MDRLKDARPEPTGLTGPPFSGVRLDRAMDARKDFAWVQRRLQEPETRAVLAGEQGVLADLGSGALVRLPLDPNLSAVPPILLGLEDGAALFAIDLGEPSVARLEAAGTVIGLREAGSELPRSEAGLAAYLVALLNWHRRHRYCANCGAATDVAEAGYSRHCPRCGADHFPRTDPVVIMTVAHEGRLLLGRRRGWPERRYSVLAGFISPGESAEEAVVREVREESGIDAHEPRFVTSQPWPFPSSLMLGFDARSDGGEPVACDDELADVRWFTRDAVRSAALDQDGELQLPPPVSIARFLIDRWLAGGED